MRKGLFGHRAAVNVVDFDEKHIVSASGDRTIKVWTATTCEFVRTLSGHRRGIGKLTTKADFFRHYLDFEKELQQDIYRQNTAESPSCLYFRN